MINRIVQEISDFNLRAKLFGGAVVVLALSVLAQSIVHVAYSSAQDQLLLLIFVVLAIVAGSHPSRFPGTKTVVSVSEVIVFLAAILQGPFQAAMLGSVDAIALSRKLAKQRVFVPINASILTLSAYSSAFVFHAVRSHFDRNPFLGVEQHGLEMYLFPLLAMALTCCLVNTMLTALFSEVVGVMSFFGALKEMYPWILVTYLAGAAVAGVTGYAFSTYTLIAALLVLLLAVPVPLIIYYTFKTYHAKLEDERRHLDQLNEIHRSTLEALAMAIDAKDQTTHTHIRRVQIYARRMGERMGMEPKELQALEAASLLHDIGKLGVPDYILNKPGKLTEHEFNKMKIHPVIGAEILSNVKFDFPVASFVRAHHERWDGCGYPDGLRGEEIPLGARILALVDHFDALHSDRPYRRALTREEALEHVKNQSGIFFDPELVELFLKNLDSFDAEVNSIVIPEPDLSSLSNAVLNNTSAPAAGYAEERRRPTEVALDRIAAAHQEVMTLHDIARVLSSTLSLQDTVAIITSRIANLVPYSTCVIYLMDSKKTSIRAEYASGLHGDLFRGRDFSMGEGITGWVIANHRPMYNTTPQLDLSFLGHDTAARYKGVAVFPVTKNGEAFGAVAFYSMDLPQYNAEHLRLLEMIMQPVSDALHNALMFENARQTALTDLLTGLPNMRAFSVHYEREFSVATRLQHPLSILVVDLNDFKKINDTFGHIVGDRVLMNIAHVIRRQLRDNDIVARYAGDEFVALLPMTDLQQASYVIKRIEQAISQFSYETLNGQQVTVSASIGAASTPGDGQTFEELMMQADNRMYRSKDNAKSRIRQQDGLIPFPDKAMRAS